MEGSTVLVESPGLLLRLLLLHQAVWPRSTFDVIGGVEVEAEAAAVEVAADVVEPELVEPELVEEGVCFS